MSTMRFLPANVSGPWLPETGLARLSALSYYLLSLVSLTLLLYPFYSVLDNPFTFINLSLCPPTQQPSARRHCGNYLIGSVPELLVRRCTQPPPLGLNSSCVASARWMAWPGVTVLLHLLRTLLLLPTWLATGPWTPGSLDLGSAPEQVCLCM